DLIREVGRKAFHLLTLVYWGAFLFFGYPRVLYWLAGWLVVVALVETARLRIPAVSRFLMTIFDGMIREAERTHYSGLLHTTAGSLLAILISGGNGAIVGTAVGQLAFGDAAAALAGKAFGKTRPAGSRKSLEGSLACLAACFAVAIAFG